MFWLGFFESCSERLLHQHDPLDELDGFPRVHRGVISLYFINMTLSIKLEGSCP